VPVHTDSMKPRHEGRGGRWLGRWLGGASICGTLALACLLPAYQLGDPLADPAHPLAEALGAFGYFFLADGVVIGLSGLVVWLRAGHERGE
jgi:hypothetical protein